jgi:hypothetical protein
MATTLFVAFESVVALFAAILVVYAFRSIYLSCFARTPCAIVEHWQCGSAMLLLALPQMLLLALFELFSAIALLAVGSPGAASASVKIGLAYVTETAHNFLLPAFLPCFVQVMRLAHSRLPIEPNTFGSRWAPYLLPTSDRAFYVALAISIAMGIVNTAAEVNASPSVEFQAQIGIDFVKFPVDPAWLGSLSTNFGISTCN